MAFSYWFDLFLSALDTRLVVSGSLALLTPIVVIYARNEVRCQRLAQILYFSRSFPQAARRTDIGGAFANPSFEFVKLKYTYDLPEDVANSDDDARLMALAKRKGFGRSDRVLFYSSIGYILICFAGFVTLLSDGCTACLGTSSCTPAGLAASLLISGGATGEASALVLATCKTLTIAGVAFLGAYVASIRQFVRSLLVFDLSPATFARQTMEVISSVVIVTVLYRAFPDPLHLPAQVLGSVSSLDSTSADATTKGLSWVWIGLALMFGLMQESSLRFVLDKFREYLPWLKRADDRFMPVTQSVPLEALDGINFPIRYRLQECGIEEVQNLATYNPIMLHIESPYGIYQATDWVGQAQLCCVVGLERFLLLRQLNLRTIFDLERAVRGEKGPPEFDRILASVLFSATNKLNDLASVSGLKVPIKQADDKIEALGLAEFLPWAVRQIGVNEVVNRSSEAKTSAFVEHLVRLIGDDLHVRRLRRIWHDISESLGEESALLPDDMDFRRAVEMPSA